MKHFISRFLHFKPGQAVALLALLLLPFQARAEFQLPDSFAVNGIPVIFDTYHNTIYATVIPEEDGSLALRFTMTGTTDSLIVNGTYVAQGDVYTVSSTVRRNACILRLSSDPSTYVRIYFTELPLVAITTSSNINTGTHTEGSFKLVDALKRTNGKDYVFEHRAGLRWRGASSSGYAKKSYAVEMWDDQNQEVDTTVIGFRSDGDVILDAAFVDHSRFRNRLLFDIWNAMDSIPYASSDESKENGTLGHFVEVFLNGQYNGLYCLTDKIDRKKLHLKKLKEEIDGTYTQRGLLWKGTSWNKGTYLSGYDRVPSANKLSWNGWEQKYPDDNKSQGYFTPLKEFIDWAAPALNTSASKIDATMEQHVYPQNVANYILFFNAFVITDNTVKNVYLSQRNTQKDQRVLFTPWDMDSSIGRTWYGGYRSDKAFTEEYMSKCQFFYRLIESENHPSFKQLVRDTWDRLKQTVLSVDSVTARINAYRDLFYNSGVWTRERNCWGTAMTSSAGSMVEISNEANYMASFYEDNFEVMDAYLSDFPSAVDEVRADAVPMAIDVSGRGIVVASPSAGRARVSIYDVGGMALQNGEVTLPYTVSGLQPGVYVVVAKIGNTLHRQKVLIK